MKISLCSLAIAALPLLVRCQDSIDCPDAPSDADCETCLNAGCVTAVGSCMSSCSFIADASCWDMQYYPDSTVEEVCATKAMEEADESICSAETAQTSCGACTSTLLSDGESTCQWYHPIGMEGYCGKGGCDMMGNCGHEVCDTGAGGPCGGFSECEPCLNSRLDCAWSAGTCLPSCGLIMDVACYHPSESAFANMTGPEICAIAAGTEEIPFNQPMDNETLPDGYHPCNGFESCEPCLNSRIECAWIADSCEPSCDVIADAACYHPSESAFANMTGPEICAIANMTEEGLPFDEAEDDEDMEDDNDETEDGDDEDEEEMEDDDEDEEEVEIDLDVERAGTETTAGLQSGAISRAIYMSAAAATGMVSASFL